MEIEYKIFNDRFFDRARRYVKNEITQEEVDLYTLGKIHKIYGSFEELLIDNIEYYSRIIRTILWLYENTLVNNGKVILKNDKVRYVIPMTPTKFYYICLTQPDFSRDEIIYGYPQIQYEKGQTFYDLWPALLKIGSFSFNVTFSVEHAATKSYQTAFEHDITDSEYLSKVIVNSKFTYIDRVILALDITNIIALNEMIFYNYQCLQKYSTDKNVVDSRPNGITYLGAGFSESVVFEQNSISRKQIGDIEHTMEFDHSVWNNLLEINKRIEHINKQLNNIQNLKLICSSMIQNYRKKFKAVRLHHDGVTYSVIKIKKFWNNFRVIETCFHKNTILYSRTMNLGKLSKVVKYITDSGYYIYTINTVDDVISIAHLDDVDEILNHYTEYINRTFVDSTLRLELMETETNKIIEKLTRISMIDNQ